jgi:hypothetical protein
MSLALKEIFLIDFKLLSFLSVKFFIIYVELKTETVKVSNSLWLVVLTYIFKDGVPKKNFFQTNPDRFKNQMSMITGN